MNEYQIIQVTQVIEKHDLDLLGKYGLYLGNYKEDSCRVEIDNIEYILPLNKINPTDGSIIALDVDRQRLQKYENLWTIRTPCQTIGVNKEKILDTCSSLSDLYMFETFLEAQQYIEENFQILQIGIINATAYQ